MRRALVVRVSVGAAVPSTADISADETYPEASGRVTVCTS